MNQSMRGERDKGRRGEQLTVIFQGVTSMINSQRERGGREGEVRRGVVTWREGMEWRKPEKSSTLHNKNPLYLKHNIQFTGRRLVNKVNDHSLTLLQ